MEEDSTVRAIWPILIGVILVLVLGIFVAPMQRLEYEIEIKVGLAVETAKSETSLSRVLVVPDMIGKKT